MSWIFQENVNLLGSEEVKVHTNNMKNLNDLIFQNIFLVYVICSLWVTCSPVLFHSFSESQTHITASILGSLVAERGKETSRP